MNEQKIASIYLAYPRKTARQNAVKAIERAVERISARNGCHDVYAWLLDRVKLYARSRENEDVRFTPHPATWFNQGRYDDDEKEWFAGKTPTVDRYAAITAENERYRQEQEQQRLKAEREGAYFDEGWKWLNEVDQEAFLREMESANSRHAGILSVCKRDPLVHGSACRAFAFTHWKRHYR